MQLFDKVEVWRKRDVSKDPIAVGVLDGERYLIARWGMEKLLPFETIQEGSPAYSGVELRDWPCRRNGRIVGYRRSGLGNDFLVARGTIRMRLE